MPITVPYFSEFYFFKFKDPSTPTYFLELQKFLCFLKMPANSRATCSYEMRVIGIRNIHMSLYLLFELFFVTFILNVTFK